MLLREALARPADAEAQARLGHHYLAAGHLFEALWALQRAREAGDASSPPGSEIARAMADALERAGLGARAEALLKEASDARPGDPSLAVRRAELHLRRGRAAAALTLLRSRPAAGPVEALLLGRALEAAGDEAGALAQYRRCLAADPDSVPAHLHLGRLLVRRGQGDAGRLALARAHQLAPADPAPLYALGLSCMPQAATNASTARYWFSEALRVSPGYAPAHVALGRLGILHRRWTLAAQQFAQAWRADPWDTEALLGLAEVLDRLGHPGEARERRGMAYVRQGKLPQALAEFRALQAARPEDRNGALLVSQTLIQMALNAEAARELTAAVARHPRDGELRERLAQVAILMHTPDLAQRVCKEWLEHEPDAARPLWLLGRTALIAPDIPRAIDDFERAAKSAPRDAEILFALGEALSRPGPRRDADRALALLAQAVELAPRESRYRYHLGLLLQPTRVEAARRQFLRALDLDPDRTAAYTGLLQVSGKLREVGQTALFAPVVQQQEEARRVQAELRRRTYQEPTAAANYAALARHLEDQGDLEGAHAQWEVAAGLRPEDRTARRELARLNRIRDLFRPPLQPWRKHLESSRAYGLASPSIRDGIGLRAAAPALGP